jgi:hypothetical protein
MYELLGFGMDCRESMSPIFSHGFIILIRKYVVLVLTKLDVVVKGFTVFIGW